MFFRDGKKFLSRAMDDTMKLWDIRQTRSGPVQEWDDLVNLSPKTGVAISPNEKVVLTGTSVRKGYGYGQVVAFSTIDGSKVDSVPISQTSVISVVWHHALNQIFVGSADASIVALYDPTSSKGGSGILKCIERQEKRRPIEGQTAFGKSILTPAEYEPDVVTTHQQSVPIFKPEDHDPQRKREKKLKDDKRQMKPLMPLQGPSKGGRTPQSGTLAQYVMQDLYKNV